MYWVKRSEDAECPYEVMDGQQRTLSLCEYVAGKFSYDFKYDVKKEAYVFESFIEVLKDQYNNEKEVCWLKRDTLNEEYECIDTELLTMMPVVAKNNVIFHLIDFINLFYLFF